jgi:hypothetical protein
MTDVLISTLTITAAVGCGLVAGFFFAFSVVTMKALGRIAPAQGIAAASSPLALDLILPHADEHIDDLFARMRVHGEHHSWVKIDAHLEYLASGHTEIVPLELGALDSLLLC